VPAPYPSQSFFGGEVLLDAQVGRDGAVSDAQVIAGESPFVDKALAAVDTWMFHPARSAGQPADTRIAIAFEFPQPYVPPRASTVHHYNETGGSGALEGVAAVPMTTVEPEYPYPSTGEGSVILYGRVGADGQLTDVKVVRDLEPLTDAAISAARQWRFAPAKRSGVAMPSAAVIVVTFRRPLVVSHTQQ
jgi:TonB family protein